MRGPGRRRRGGRRPGRRPARALRRPRGLDRARSSTATTPRSTSRAPSTARRSTGLTATDFLYEVGSELVVPKLDEELRGKKPGDIAQVQRRAARALRRARRRRGRLPGAGEGGQAQGAARAHRRVGLRGQRVRHPRRAAGRHPQPIENVRRMQAQMAVRDKVLEAVGAKLVRRDPRAARPGGDGAPAARPRHRLEEQGATSSSTWRRPARTQDQFVADVRSRPTKAVLADLALRAVVAQEEIEATDDELDAEIDRLAERTGRKPAQVRKELERGGSRGGTL